MSPYLLNLLYVTALLGASPWLLWRAIRTGRYRQGVAAKLLGSVPRRNGDRRCVWLHAVSVGEVNLLAPLLAQLDARQPEWECVISTTTRTGYELARRRYAGRAVFYCPLDFTWGVRRAMRRLRPDLLVLAELELWPNLIRAAGERGARVAVINGRLGARSYRGYRRIRPLLAGTLGRLDLVAAQNATYAGRFRDLGARDDVVQVTGSVKFDGAPSDRNNRDTLELVRLAGIAADDVVLLAGSTQEPEERLALETYRALAADEPRLRLLLVPRHPERFDGVAAMLEASGIPFQRRSELDVRGTDPRCRVLLVDAVGELGAWWGAAQIAFVGGSLGRRGGQNMIEPAAYGAAISFGPNTWNFRDVVAQLLEREAAVVVEDGAALTAFVGRCLREPDYASQLGARARDLVTAQQGAAARTVALLEALLEEGAKESPATRAA